MRADNSPLAVSLPQPVADSVPCAPPAAEQARWFADEVQPHESVLKAWLRGRFPWLVDVDDLVQESYVRLFRAKGVGKVGHAKSYLFATARNAALDLARRRQVILIESLTEIERLSVLENRRDAAETLNHDQEVGLLAEAIQALPARCRLVLKLRKLRGLPTREIARRLDISEHTVNAQLASGLARCREYLRERGVEKP